MRTRKFGIVIVMALLLATLMGYAIISLSKMNARIADAEQKRDELRAEAQALAVGNASMEYEIAHSDDLDMIEKVAREKLGLILPGEIVYYDISN